MGFSNVYGLGYAVTGSLADDVRLLGDIADQGWPAVTQFGAGPFLDRLTHVAGCTTHVTRHAVGKSEEKSLNYL